jgi:DNA-binding phage protein
MIGSSKRFLITGLTIIILGIPFSQNAVVLAKEQSKVEQTSKQQKKELIPKQALDLAVEFNKVSNYVQRGGDYKKDEYKTFSYNNKNYRYLSSSIDTKKKLKSYLEKVIVPSEVEQFIKSRGIIEYKGKLAQVEADGGSLLQWEKATAKYVKNEKNTIYYRLTIPVWNTNEKQDFIVEYQYLNNIGWKISKEPKQEKSTASTISSKVAIEMAAKFITATSYVQAGGEYGPGEYKTFSFNGKTYRYLSSKIDTKSKLNNYLTQSMTQSAADQFIKDRGIIEYNGKLAQIEADGGSLEEWTKASAEFIKTDKNTTFYRVTVPFGEMKEKQMYIIEYQYVEKTGWRVSKEPYWDLDIPGNINPISILFNYLLVDSKVAQNQFFPYSSFNVTEFKKGIKKVEFIKLTEVGRSGSQVEYIASINVELENNYYGPLMSGENKMYFTVQPTGYMEFKIDQVGIVNMY